MSNFGIVDFINIKNKFQVKDLLFGIIKNTRFNRIKLGTNKSIKNKNSKINKNNKNCMKWSFLENERLKKISKNKAINIMEINIIILILLISILIPEISFCQNIQKFRKLNLDFEITLIIKGTGNQKILNDKFRNLPNSIIVNGISLETNINNTISNLIEEENNITMIWNYDLTNCEDMFNELSNIKEIYFKNFDTSKIVNMRNMFRKCSSITSLDLNKFNTSLVTTMAGMFSNCISLKTLNLSNFQTSNVEIMNSMFYECSNLTTLDLSNFDTSKVNTMKDMFFGCKSLVSINVDNFNTLLVKDMAGLFYGCSSLKSLSINHFETKNVEKMDGMFKGCNSLESLDIKNFDTTSVINMRDMFSSCDNLKELNIKNFYTKNVKDMKGMFYRCLSLTSLDLNNFDTSSVTTMEGMFYGCNLLIYLNINNFDTSNVTDMSNMFRECKKLISLNLISFNFSLVDKMDNIFNNINEELIYCINENNSNILSLIESKVIGKINYDDKICVENCSKETFEFNNKCYTECPEGTKVVSINYNLCERNIIETINIEKIEISELVEEKETKKYFNINDFYNNIINIHNKSNFDEDDIISNIQKELLSGALNELISNIILKEKNDLSIQEKNVIYQITSSENQNNKNYNNISTIKLGECETKLKQKYNISDNESLIIFKYDYYEEGLLIPIIEYEVYHPNENKKLDLNICENIIIDISIPVIINEENLFKYNSSNEYYNDLCFPYTTEKGTDITLTDRKNEFINNNMSLCEKNCEYNGYDIYTKKALCQCKTKKNMNLLSKISFDKDKLLKNFKDIKEKINIYTMKCINLVFSKEGLINNIGSYILLSIILINIILVIIFRIKGYIIIINQINHLANIWNNNNPYKKNNISIFKINKNKIIKKKKSSNKKGIKNKNYKKQKKDKNKILKNKNSPPKKYKNNININEIKKNIDFNFRNSSKYELKTIEKIDKEKNSNIDLILSNKNIIHKNKISNNEIIKYNDYEINDLNYENALEIDKRTYFQYYFSLIKRKQILIFTFFTKDDFNSRTIKISLFLFSFSLYFAVNSLFFNDSTMHKIYEDEGSFNFIYQIPQILFSTIISSVISFIIKFLSLTEKNILSIKKAKEKQDEIVSKVLKCLIIKFVSFFLLNFIFLIFFWYYLSSFCSVYKNTQMHLIKDTIISFGTSLLYPFGLNLLPGIFRIPALRSKKKDKRCMYKFSQIVQIV